MNSNAEGPVEPRGLNAWEQDVLARLLSVDFGGRNALSQQVPYLKVTYEWGKRDPTVEFVLTDASTAKADVEQRIPVEARATDSDGAEINILLHVVDGILDELEVYRSDGEPLHSLPQPDALQPFSSPPYQHPRPS